MDKKIEEHEQELARLQTDNALKQLESNLVRESLKNNLDIVGNIASVAMEVIDNLHRNFDTFATEMRDELNGKG